ncbi:unnamed protein product [Lactuca saligna]|uniref:Uncharacterized protein n=1 Tax=Lactuca saligna TaxID=75948 RepID=A0AA35Z0H7_LACSI|nr:unnamed protein product [Lactuca saligna]
MEDPQWKAATTQALTRESRKRQRGVFRRLTTSLHQGERHANITMHQPKYEAKIAKQKKHLLIEYEPKSRGMKGMGIKARDRVPILPPCKLFYRRKQLGTPNALNDTPGNNVRHKVDRRAKQRV